METFCISGGHFFFLGLALFIYKMGKERNAAGALLTKQSLPTSLSVFSFPHLDLELYTAKETHLFLVARVI